MASSQSPQGQQIDLGSLSTQQLSQLKKQLDTELEHLTNSFQSLRSAQAKFRDCLKSIKTVEGQKETSKPHLIPLTSSLYVPGFFSHLAPSSTSPPTPPSSPPATQPELLIDVGTGFFVSKSPKEATEFYNGKIKDLEGSLKDLEGVIQGKGQNLGVVEQVLRGKVLSQGAGGKEAEEGKGS